MTADGVAAGARPAAGERVSDVALVVPMAGRGSRFAQHGRPTPKPLIEIDGRPFFWWAVESVRAAAPVGEMVFVVLADHMRAFAIDERVNALYPAARLVVLPEVTAGAAETAAAGVAALAGAGPFAVNDCDHAFVATGLSDTIAALRADAAGALVGFRASSPAYSYARLDAAGRVRETVEKRVVSPFAIAGCYLFADRDAFAERFARYRQSCPYPELFISGLYNAMIADGDDVRFHELSRHLSFGTPEELAAVGPDALAAVRAGWASAGWDADGGP